MLEGYNRPTYAHIWFKTGSLKLHRGTQINLLFEKCMIYSERAYIIQVIKSKSTSGANFVARTKSERLDVVYISADGPSVLVKSI